MVHYLQCLFDPFMLKPVIQSGKCKHHQKTKSINAGANDAVEVISFYGKSDEKRNRNDAEQNAKAVHNTIYQFLLEPNLGS